MCGAECESVVYVLWECSAYSNIRAIFVEKLREVLGDRYVNFDKLNSIEKTAYVLGSELWEYDFDHLISLVKEYVVGIWDACKQKLYSDGSCPSQLQSLAEDLQLAGVEGQTDVKLCSSGERGTGGKDLPVRTCMCSSAHDCGCMVNDSNAMVPLMSIIYSTLTICFYMAHCRLVGMCDMLNLKSDNQPENLCKHIVTCINKNHLLHILHAVCLSVRCTKIELYLSTSSDVHMHNVN